MSRLAAYTHLILEAVRDIHRRHAIAGWYDVTYLIKWLKAKHKQEWKALYAEFLDCPDPMNALLAEIDAYLPALNPKKLGTRPIEPKGSIILWRVSSKTAPPAQAPAPKVKKARPAQPRRARGQPWITRIDNGDLVGLRRWLDGGGDPNAPGRGEGEAPLDYAAASGDVAMVRLLLERGAKGQWPLREAVLNFRGAAARLLLDYNVSLQDLCEARAVVRDLVDDPELARLIEKELRRRRRRK